LGIKKQKGSWGIEESVPEVGEGKWEKSKQKKVDEKMSESN